MLTFIISTGMTIGVLVTYWKASNKIRHDYAFISEFAANNWINECTDDLT